ncbi:MAG: beta-glucosidase H [Thermomicrobiales bacterium]
MGGGESSAAEERISALLRAMTLAEKVTMLSGATLWLTSSIERLGLPTLKVSDGPNGVRGEGAFTGASVTSACFPAAVCLASTWDTELIAQIGVALGEEAKTKGVHLVLGPTINIHRSPLNGRNFECYSEDPYLSARIAVAFITGLQSQHVGAVPKHLVCNDSEFERATISSDVDERTMREIYLPPFSAAVTEAKPWAVMAGYNKVNGVYAGESRALLIDLVKDEWGFDGVIMSDWFGTQSTVEAAANGLDLEMPGPPIWRGPRLVAAVEAGDVSEEAIDEAVRRVLRIVDRAGAFAHPDAKAEEAIDRPEHRALARKVAADGVVLLKNQHDVLPLDKAQISKLAIIGPNAKVARISGGGSAQVNAHYRITPYDGIASGAGDQIELGYELGCTNHKWFPLVAPDMVSPKGQNTGCGFAVTYYNSLDLSGDPVYETVVKDSEQWWLGGAGSGVHPRQFSARLAATFTPHESGPYQFGLMSAGLSRLVLDGRVVIDNWTSQTPGDAFFSFGSTEVRATVDLTAGQPHELIVEYSSEAAFAITAVRFGLVSPQPADAIEGAAALAAGSDIAVIFAGTNGEWETEGNDRAFMDLPGEQNALIERVAAANPRTIVVLQTGSPVAMPWLDKVAGVMQAWFGGQECGNAIADVLFGAVNPSAKLTQTFPVRIEDNPAYLNYPGENGHVRYGERIFVGYRYYDQKRVAPLFPFGHGLSYTTFAYDNLRLSSTELGQDDHLTVVVDVTNTGRRAGQEIVQLYVRDVAARLSRPEKELKGFAKVALAPGETIPVSLTLDRTAFAYWDDRDHAWVAEAGDFEVLIGGSAQDIRTWASVRLTETAVFGGPAMAESALAEVTG